MTQVAHQQQIKEQMEALDRITANATKSKEAATKYLIDAGIIEPSEDTQAEDKTTTKKKK